MKFILFFIFAVTCLHNPAFAAKSLKAGTKLYQKCEGNRQKMLIEILKSTPSQTRVKISIDNGPPFERVKDSWQKVISLASYEKKGNREAKGSIVSGNLQELANLKGGKTYSGVVRKTFGKRAMVINITAQVSTERMFKTKHFGNQKVFIITETVKSRNYSSKTIRAYSRDTGHVYIFSYSDSDNKQFKCWLEKIG